jgi:hypothetical protein
MTGAEARSGWQIQTGMGSNLYGKFYKKGAFPPERKDALKINRSLRSWKLHFS